jgi:O-antigen ligase
MPFSRLSIGDVEPNVAARVFFVGATIMFFSYNKIKWSLLKWVTVLAMLATFSRSGFLALISLFVGILRRKLAFFFITVIVVIILVAFTSIGDIRPISIYTGRIMDALYLADNNTRMRLFMDIRGVEIFAETWLIGVGMNNYPIDVGAVHNVLVNVAAETGIFGLIGYLLIYFTIFKVSRLLEKGFGMLTVMFVGTFIFDMFMPLSENRIFWFPFSLILALYIQQLHVPHRLPAIKSGLNQMSLKQVRFNKDDLSGKAVEQFGRRAK